MQRSAPKREVVLEELGIKLGGIERTRDRMRALLALALAGASLTAGCGEDAATQGAPPTQDASVDRQFQAADRGSRYARREAAPEASASGDTGAEDATPDAAPDVASEPDASCESGATVDACGPTCKVCTAPENGVAKCLDGDCTVVCDKGFIPSALRCVVPDLYVDAVNGSDENVGSETSPFKTFRKAMLTASSGQTVHFVADVIEQENGDDFAQPIPDGVRLVGRPDQTAFFATSSAVLTFAGSGEIRDMYLVNGLVATKGRQDLVNVTIREQKSSVRVSGEADMHCLVCLFETQVQRTINDSALIVVEDSAKLELLHSDVEPDRMYRELGCATFPTDGIRVNGSASLKLEDTQIWGGFGVGLFVDTHGTVELSRSHINPGCREESLQAGIGWYATRLNLDLSESSFYGRVYILGSPARIHARNSGFYGPKGVFFEGSRDRTYDFGTATSPGRNTFQSANFSNMVTHQQIGLDIESTSDIVVDASGNTWVPNEQGADAEGHYASDAALVLRNATGRNVRVFDSSSVRF